MRQNRVVPLIECHARIGGVAFVVCGLRFVVCGLWFVVCGLRFVVCGLWFVVCGLWFAVCGKRAVTKRPLGIITS